MFDEIQESLPIIGTILLLTVVDLYADCVQASVPVKSKHFFQDLLAGLLNPGSPR